MPEFTDITTLPLLDPSMFHSNTHFVIVRRASDNKLYQISMADLNAVAGVGGPVNYHINCGGGIVGAFVADVSFVGGNVTSTGNAVDVTGVANAAPSTCYQSVRYGNNFSYAFAGFDPTKTYKVRVHLAESFHGGTLGTRPMNIDAVGATTVNVYNGDPGTSAGAVNKAFVAEHDLQSDGSGTISIFIATVAGANDPNALICALEILEQ